MLFEIETRTLPIAGSRLACKTLIFVRTFGNLTRTGLDAFAASPRIIDHVIIFLDIVFWNVMECNATIIYNIDLILAKKLVFKVTSEI